MPAAAPDRPLPLCVDLDGTLLRGDSLVEGALALAARAPWSLPARLARLRHGRAALKQSLARDATLDPARLPWNPAVLALLEDAGAAGRTRVLCTGADARVADAVAGHLGLFEEVIASDGRRNLTGEAKAAALVERFGERGFDYAGNARDDLAVWAHARGAIVVGAGDDLAREAAQRCTLLAHLPQADGGLRAWRDALRPHQWLKNLLVCVPLLAAHRLLDPASALAALGAFLAFCLCASGAYLLNDLLDLQADRAHPRKRQRALASGRLAPAAALLAAPLLAAAGLGLAAAIGPGLAALVGAYVAATLAYSLGLKRVAALDVVALALLYTLRVLAGAAAIGVPVSFWLLAFSMFIFTSLALLKRCTELVALREAGRREAEGRGYHLDDLPLLRAVGAGAGLVAVLVLALYVDSPGSRALYARPEALWLLCPLVLGWVLRAWLLAHRGRMHDDPVVFALTDRSSLVVGAGCALALLAAL